MVFTKAETLALLEVKGVAPTVIKRFEEIGITSFHELSQYDAEEIAEKVAYRLNSTCWKNSPKARAAIQGAIDVAKHKE